MKLPVTLDTIPEFIRFVSRNAAKRGLDDETILKLEVAVEEAMVNIYHHAYKNAEGNAEVICLGDDNRFVITITDSGGQFDITRYENPSVSDISELEIGGQGIRLIKKIFDEVHYSRKHGKNIMQLVVYNL